MQLKPLHFMKPEPVAKPPHPMEPEPVASPVVQLHKSMSSAGCAGGFTLLEMLVSIFILALVIVSILKMQAGSIRLSESGSFYSNASCLARLKLADLTVGLEEKDSQEHVTGDFGENFPDYRWRGLIETPEISDMQLPENMAATVEAIMGKHLVERLRRIDVEILHANGDTFRISTWRFLQDE